MARSGCAGYMTVAEMDPGMYDRGALDEVVLARDVIWFLLLLAKLM